MDRRTDRASIIASRPWCPVPPSATVALGLEQRGPHGFTMRGALMRTGSNTTAVEPGPFVQITNAGPYAVIQLDGEATTALLAALCDVLDLWGDHPLVIDVSEICLHDADAVRDLVSVLELDAHRGRCIVSRRGTSRALIRRVGRTHLPVFGSVADAERSQCLVESGHRTGWDSPHP